MSPWLWLLLCVYVVMCYFRRLSWRFYIDICGNKLHNVCMGCFCVKVLINLNNVSAVVHWYLFVITALKENSLSYCLQSTCLLHCFILCKLQHNLSKKDQSDLLVVILCIIITIYHVTCIDKGRINQLSDQVWPGHGGMTTCAL